MSLPQNFLEAGVHYADFFPGGIAWRLDFLESQQRQMGERNRMWPRHLLGRLAQDNTSEQSKNTVPLASLSRWGGWDRSVGWNSSPCGEF